MNFLLKDILNLEIQKKELILLIRFISRKLKEEVQNLIYLFKDLRDGNINPKEVLKDQINFKSDLGKTKKRKCKIMIKISNKCDTKC